MRYMTAEDFTPAAWANPQDDALAFAQHTRTVRKKLAKQLAETADTARELHALGVRCGPEFDDYASIADLLDLARDKPEGCATDADVLADDEERYLTQIGEIE